MHLISNKSSNELTLHHTQQTLQHKDVSKDDIEIFPKLAKTVT